MHRMGAALGAAAAVAACCAAAAASCTTDVQCSLNGACRSGACVCDAPWSGPQCASLQVKPLPPPPFGFGMAPNHTTWGGNVVQVDGQYHLFVAEMVNDCPLRDWGKNSRCSHAVSTSPLGPFEFVDVAVDV